jgi:aminoglycoside 3-N-acetyltransferase I
MTLRTLRLKPADVAHAKRLFDLMASVFEEDPPHRSAPLSGEPAEPAPLSDAYVGRLLARPDFWAIAAFSDGDVVGGLTAHTLPMTRAEASEVFIYDIAVRADQQRRGIGRQLVKTLRDEAASLGYGDVFVAADDEDTHALDFYRAIGGSCAAVTIFTFSAQ